jgi:hypothetical protein
MNRVHLSAKDLEEAADVPVFGTTHRCSEADSIGSDVLASGAVRFPERAACARRLSENRLSVQLHSLAGKCPSCLNVKSREEHEVLQAAELSAKLIQRTTSEALHRLCTSLDWMFTRRRSAIA